MSKCSTCESIGEPEEMTEIGNTGEFYCESCWSGGEKKKFAFDVILHIEEFEAYSPLHAEEMLNKYIDRLATIEDNEIRWGSLDLTEIDTRLA